MSLQDDIFANKVIAFLQKADKDQAVEYMTRVDDAIKVLPLHLLIRIEEEYLRVLSRRD